MRTRLIAALVAAGSIPLVAVAQDGGGQAGAPAARAAVKKAPPEKARAGARVGVPKRPAALEAHGGKAKGPTPAKKATASAAPIPAADPELVATAQLFFQGLTSQVPAAMADLSGFPFDLDGQTIRSKASLVSRLTELFQGKDFSRLPLYGIKTLRADAMVEQYGPPPARLGRLDLKDAWVAIADLGGHGYVAVFKKSYGRWVAVAYTD